jgi:uroporphyrinogen decarboxylase
MTPREIIQAVIDHDNPPRIGWSFPAPYRSDFASASLKQGPRFTDWVQTGPDRWEHTDDWGNVWYRGSTSSSGEILRPAIASWDDLKTYEFPDFSDPQRYVGVAEKVAASQGKYILGGLPGFPFNVARYLRKLENFLADLVLEPRRVNDLLTRVADVLIQAIERYGQLGHHAIMFCEDWGLQDRLMIHPTMWREVFKPHFRRLVGVARENGLRVFMHSCGKVTDIIPDLIEVGVAVLQFDQQKVHGLDTLAKFSREITFWCPVDVQQVLPTRDRAKIEDWARQLVERLGRGGGFIAGYYGSYRDLGITEQEQDWACQAFIKHGTFRPDGT